MSNDDITFNYHGGNPQSSAANRRTNKRRDAARVYAYVHSCGLDGAISDEVQVALGMEHQTCSARFSELKRDGFLVPTGRTRLTRKRCRAEVCVAKPFSGNGDAVSHDAKDTTVYRNDLFE